MKKDEKVMSSKSHDMSGDMSSKTQENREKEVEDYLFLTNLRWAEIHTRIMNRVPITPDMKKEYELATDKLTQLLAKQKTKWVEEGWQIGYKQCKEEK